MKIKFCGAVSSVTGSCHLVTTEKHKILMDCGMFQGGKTLEQQNLEPFPFVPSEIESVILSHAHVDHCGRLPLLVKQGFTGPIYCTDATADLLQVMLPDCAHIQEKETEWANKKAARKGLEQTEPMYTMDDALETLKLVRPVLYDQLFELNDEMQVVFNDAGHILGSAITEIWITEHDKTIKLVYTGDIGVTDRPILRDPVKIKKADFVVMESTYGNRLHESNDSSVNELIRIIEHTVRRGGNVIIPSFAVGRTQELIYELNRFYESSRYYHKLLSDVQVYIDSPMAITTTQVFRRNAQVFDEETKEYILSGDNPLDFPNLHFLSVLLLLLPSEPGESLTVISEGGTVGTYSLSQDREFTVGGNTIVISDGAVHMKAADCPGGDCLSAGEISRAGESIVCLPNRLILRIDGTSGDGPDAMTGGVGG